jgi:hypothetical protein
MTAPDGATATGSAAAPAPIVASNLRLINKNTLVGSVDLTVSKWRFKFRGCLWHRKDDREWVNFPAREWVDEDGNRKFSHLGEFVNHGDARRFQAASLAAIRELAKRSAP